MMKIRFVALLVLLIHGVQLYAQDENFGYTPNPEATRLFAQSLPDRVHASGTDSPHEEEYQNYRYELRCLQTTQALSTRYLRDGRKVAPNQGRVGSCTGFGTAGVLNIALAKYCVDHGLEKWYRPISESAAYANGREAGGMLGSGDGGYGSACAKSTQTLGMLWKIPFPKKDLSEYTEDDARELGRYGIGKYGLKPESVKMLAGTVVQVRSAADAKEALKNGMGINVCSQQAFSTQRDANGVCEADNRKRWAHSMTVVGYRTVNMEGKLQTFFRIQQSWGDSSPTGPLVGDMGYGMFDIRESVMDKMLSQGDSFAYGDLQIEDAPSPNRIIPRRTPWWCVAGVMVLAIGCVYPRTAMVIVVCGYTIFQMVMTSSLPFPTP